LARLLLVRHGDTGSSSTRKLWGCSDIELSAAGLRQAERVRDRLATHEIGTIYSSNLKRALVTAETIASRHQSDVITCAELREMSYGHLEGLTFDEISRLHPEATKLWIERNPGLRFPGGESLTELDSRVSGFLGRLDEHAPDETMLIVAHSGSLRILVCHLLGIELKLWWQIRLDFASLSIFDTHPQGAVLSLLNDISHLT